MRLDPDEKELLKSFERGEWTSVDGGEIARMRELARHQLSADVRAGVDVPDRGEVRKRDAEPGRLADRNKAHNPASRSKKP